MNNNPKWILYGAYGYTGKLLLEEAIKRGHRPIIAGRNEKKLSELVEKFNVEKIVINLEDESKLTESLEGVELILNSAGPFIYTAGPILKACLRTKTNYIDITGEIPVFQKVFELDREAKEKGICMLPGAGFDVVPTDCLAKYLSERMSDAVSLELAFLGLTVPSAGTAKTMVEMLPEGGLVRRKGKLVRQALGEGVKRIRFPNREFLAVPIPWGDLETAYRSTGIPDITTLIVYPETLIRGMKIFSPLVKKLTKPTIIRRILQRAIERTISGPDEMMRERGKSYIYGVVRNGRGETKEAWLETPEVYKFTALSGIRCVEGILSRKPTGALTPSLAFGADFVFQIEGTKRYEHLP